MLQCWFVAAKALPLRAGKNCTEVQLVHQCECTVRDRRSRIEDMRANKQWD